MNSPAIKLCKSKIPLNGVVVPIVVILVSLMLAVSGAFNTRDLELLHRVVLWVLVCVLVAGQVLGLSHLLRRYISKRFSYVRLVSGLISVILTIPLLALQLHALKYTPLLPKQPDPALEFLLFVAPPVIVIGGLFLLIQYLLQQSLKETNGRVASTSNQVDAASVPEWRRSKTLRIQVEDHYLRIYNESKSFYIRGKLSDAVSILDADEGMQVHRSHWVSFMIVKALVKDGRDYRLALFDGDFVPVGRGRLRELRKALEERAS